METLEHSFVEEEDTQHGKFLTFSVADEVYGIEIRHVTEIVRMQPVIAVPDTPGHIKGIINLRGRIIPVTDMRTRFMKESMACNDRTCIIVVNLENNTAGMIVDNVSEVITISDENTVPPPEEVQNRYVKAIGRVGEGVVLLLDCTRVLVKDEMDDND